LVAILAVKSIYYSRRKREEEEVDIKIACEKCGKSPKPDAAKSNKNWTVFNFQTPCEFCGGKLIMVFPEEAAAGTMETAKTDNQQRQQSVCSRSWPR
jgi:hypothetical protein